MSHRQNIEASKTNPDNQEMAAWSGTSKVFKGFSRLCITGVAIFEGSRLCCVVGKKRNDGEKCIRGIPRP